MPQYFHVDVESTSKFTWNGVLLSIGAVEQESGQQFHMVFNDVDDQTLPWEPTTWDWWHSEDMVSAHDRIKKQFERDRYSPELAIVTFSEWVRDFPEQPTRTFCAWPASFDYPYVDEMFGAYDIVSPFHYRTLDVKSYLCGKLGIDIDAPRTAFPDWTELSPDHEHDALSDAIAQMQVFKRAIES